MVEGQRGEEAVKIHWGSGRISPRNAQNEPPKFIKEPPKICIEFNAKQNKECHFHASKLEK